MINNLPPNTIEYRGRLLLKTDTEKLLYRRGKLIYEVDNIKKVYKLNKYCKGIKKLAIKFRFFERLLRLEPRCACKTNDGIIFSYQKSIYRINYDGQLIKEHTFREGMNNPLSFTEIKGLGSFEEGVLYGEYWANPKREGVAIWHRNNQGDWKKVFTFEPKQLKHIHCIVPDIDNERLLVLTGDSDEESNIWEIKDNFKKVDLLVGGAQKYRSCVAFIHNGDLIYATDTPLEDNFIYKLKKGESTAEKLFQLQGSCIYGTSFIDKQGIKQFVFITAVEPDSSLKGWRYKLTNKLGKGIKSRYSYINLLSENGEFKVLMKAKKDFLPMCLFQFGNFRVSEINKGFAVTGQALRKYDERTIEFDL